MEDRRQSTGLLRREATARPEGQEVPRFDCQIIRAYFADGNKQLDSFIVDISHRRTVPSLPPVASVLPSGENAAASTSSVWPRSFPLGVARISCRSRRARMRT